MFIFDAGQAQKKIHGMRISRCEICKKKTPHNLTEIGYYVTALETPLVPFKKRYLLICQHCGGGKELSRNEFDQLREYREEASVESYNQPLDLGKKSAEKTKSPKKTPRFCRKCGQKLRAGAKFCGECGCPTQA